jgi:hypothetical protein
VIALVLTLLVVALPLLGLFTAFGFKVKFKPSRSRLFIALVTYAVSFLSVTPVSFLLVMVIAGPHSGVLPPGIYSQITFVAGLLCVLIIPASAVYAALRRLSVARQHANGRST